MIDQSAVEPGLILNEKGRCPACEKKPLVYKRRHMKFCCGCLRHFDIDTGKQIESFAWKAAGPFMFVKA
jgi:hypothetical protein